jgi:hypothetical protein
MVIGKKEKPAKAEKIQTSREMLADLNKMESETDEMVIKKARKPREIKVVEEFVVAPVVINCLVEHKIDVDNYFDTKLAEFKTKINGLMTIRYENLYVPLEQFSIAMMDKLSKEKWRLVDFWYQADIKARGFLKTEVAVMERIVSQDNKPKPEFKL